MDLFDYQSEEQRRRDATCPITAEATRTGGGGKIFKPAGEKVKPLVPQFPLAEPVYINPYQLHNSSSVATMPVILC